MKVRFEAKFAKDLRNIKDGKLLAKVKEIIIDCQKAESLVDLNHIKKLQGYENYYRIRAGDFRIGLELVSGELIFTCCLHRKDIYKYFP